MPKPRKCPICESEFKPFRIGQKTCFAPACAVRYALSDQKLMERVAKRASAIQNKKARQWRREAKERLLTRSDWLKRCQRAFNQMINRRDQGKPCIACNKPITGIVHASHYRTVASSPHLRFDERNVWSGCQKCNVFLVGNIVNYRINLVSRIGEAAVLQLEADQSVKKWSVDDIKGMMAKFNGMYKAD